VTQTGQRSWEGKHTWEPKPVLKEVFSSGTKLHMRGGSGSDRGTFGKDVNKKNRGEAARGTENPAIFLGV